MADGGMRYARRFPARLDALPAVSLFVREACDAAGLARDTGLKLGLVVEELFTNTVRHGHRGDSDEPVHLTVDTEPGRIALTYEDTAPPHDPFTAVTRPDEAASVEERAVGGLGVLLVATLARDVEYRRADGRNRIRLVVAQRA